MREKTQRPPKGKSDDTAMVGIFFVVGPKLWIDATPLPLAGRYGEFRIHEPGHQEYWDQLIAKDSVPAGSEYDNYPRGRVAFNERTKQFSLLADRCILRDKKRVAKIMERMCLPADRTTKGTDPHYECPRCSRNQ
jgi:hypothetical protein